MNEIIKKIKDIKINLEIKQKNQHEYLEKFCGHNSSWTYNLLEYLKIKDNKLYIKEYKKYIEWKSQLSILNSLL